MTSKQLHIASAASQFLNALATLLSQVGVLPHIPVQYNVAISGALLAASHFLSSVVDIEASPETIVTGPVGSVTKNVMIENTPTK